MADQQQYQQQQYQGAPPSQPQQQQQYQQGYTQEQQQQQYQQAMLNQQQQLQNQQEQQMQSEQFVPNQHRQQQQQTLDNIPQNQSAYYPQSSNNRLQTQDFPQGNQSYISEGGTRRKYPTNLQGQKTEWHGVEKHKKEVDFEIYKNEKAINDIKMKHLLTELDRKLLAEYELKQEKLLIKQLEAEEMVRQMHAYHDKLNQNRQDQKQIKNHLASFYDQQRNDQAQRDTQFRDQRMQWENQLIDFNRSRLDEDKIKMRNQKDYLNQEKRADINREQIKKDQFNQQQVINKQEHNQLMQINNEKQLIKEENYRQFYRDVAENQEQQYLIHYDSVMKPMLQKISELEAIINRNVGEVQRRRAQEELSKILRQKNELQAMNQENISLMAKQAKLNDLYKIEKQQQVQGRLEDLANYNQYMEHQRNLKFEKQAELRRFLDQQKEENTQKYLNQERMSKNEKGLNRLDLQAFKEREGGLYSMLPGWQPQIGQLPPRQNRDQLTRQIMDTMKPVNTRTNSDLNNVQAQYTATALTRNQANRLANVGSQSMSNIVPAPQTKEYQRIGETDEHYQQGRRVIGVEQTLGKEYNRKDIYKYNHNPITNPMPYNIQNPYISQQYLHIKDQQGGQTQQQQYPQQQQPQQAIEQF